jgi:hypothetical protein
VPVEVFLLAPSLLRLSRSFEWWGWLLLWSSSSWALPLVLAATKGADDLFGCHPASPRQEKLLNAAKFPHDPHVPADDCRQNKSIKIKKNNSLKIIIYLEQWSAPRITGKCHPLSQFCTAKNPLAVVQLDSSYLRVQIFNCQKWIGQGSGHKGEHAN